MTRIVLSPGVINLLTFSFMFLNTSFTVYRWWQCLTSLNPTFLKLFFLIRARLRKQPPIALSIPPSLLFSLDDLDHLSAIKQFPQLLFPIPILDLINRIKPGLPLFNILFWQIYYHFQWFYQHLAPLLEPFQIYRIPFVLYTHIYNAINQHKESNDREKWAKRMKNHGKWLMDFRLQIPEFLLDFPLLGGS